MYFIAGHLLALLAQVELDRDIAKRQVITEDLEQVTLIGVVE